MTTYAGNRFSASWTILAVSLGVLGWWGGPSGPGFDWSGIVEMAAVDDDYAVSLGDTLSVGGESGDIIPENSDKYFVGTGGSDSDDGLTHATRWVTLDKVNTTVNATSADVYLLSDSIFEDQTLSVEWSGTTNDRVVVGSYCFDGTAPRVWASGGAGCGAKAEINGNFEPSCASAGTCLFNEPGAIPSSRFSALLTVTQYAPYTTVQNLIVRDSAGVAITVDGNRVVPMYGIVENNDVYLTAGMAIQGGRLADNDGSVFRNNYMEEVSTVRVYGYATVWPGCLVMNTNTSASVDVLLENNVITNCGGEGIGILRVGNVIVRGNEVSNTRRPHIYVDNGFDNVVENNQFYGIGFDGSRGFSNGMGNFVEAYSTQTSATGNIYRNNIVANVQTTMLFGVQTSGLVPGNPASEGFQVGAKVYGNTFILGDDAIDAVRGENLQVNNNVDYIDHRSNIIQNSGECNWPNLGANDDWSYNVWPSGGPTDSDCDGTNQQEGDAEIPVSPISGISGNNYDANIPTIAELTPSSTGVANNAGDPTLDTAVCLDAANYPQSFPAISDTVTETNWEACLYYDFNNAVRDSAAPDAGAVEN